MIQLAISSIQTAARSFRVLDFKDAVPSQTSMCARLKADAELQENLATVHLTASCAGGRAMSWF